MGRPVIQERTADLFVCPVCATQLRAKVDVELRPELGDIKVDGSIEATVNARMVRFNVNHVCTGPLDVESEGGDEQ